MWTHNKHAQVISVWNAADGTVFTPVLNGAPTGEERKKYIENLEVFALLLEDTENE